jgi:hypothetical protein
MSLGVRAVQFWTVTSMSAFFYAVMDQWFKTNHMTIRERSSILLIREPELRLGDAGPKP